MKISGLVFILSIFTASVFSQQTSWVNYDNAVNPSAKFVDVFLNKMKGNIQIMLCNYDNARLVSKKVFSGYTLKTPGAEWKCSVKRSTVFTDNQSVEFDATFAITNGKGKNAGVAVSFCFNN